MPILETKAAGSAQGFGGISAKASSGPVTYIEDVFSTYLYTGNGSTQTITNGIDLSGKGGLVWLKARSAASDNSLYDTARGAQYTLYSNLTLANDYGGSPVLSAFTSSGFSLGSNGTQNGSGVTFASWTFRKQPKFFDVVTWTGDGTGTSRTLNHNLGSTPGFYVCKATSTTGDWIVGVPSLGQNRWGLLNSNSNFGNNTTYWQAATSTTFGPQNTGGSNLLNVSGVSYVAYLFAHNAGGFGLSGTDNVVSCGSFSSQGQVTLGYEPQWVMIKSTTDTGSYTGDWRIFDNMRGVVEGDDNQLFANSSRAEDKVTFGTALTFNATGFNVEGQGNYGSSTIYIAIRRGPMKVPTSGTSVFSPVTFTVSGGTGL